MSVAHNSAGELARQCSKFLWLSYFGQWA